MDIRTDLALELRDGAIKNECSQLEGTELSESTEGGCKLTKIHVDGKGAGVLGCPAGNYVTVEFPRFGAADTEKFNFLCEILTRELCALISGKLASPVKKVLVACLGNADISADALGPLTAKSLIITGHLKALDTELFESFGGVELTALSLGVMAQTGIESADIMKSVVAKTRPDAVIAVDALSSRELSRLASTLQLSDAGISPGAGVGNFRTSLNEKTLGVPVFSIGVPTMVEISALVCDALAILGLDGGDDVRRKLGENGRLLVAPKDSAVIIADLAKLIGFAIDKAFIKDLDYSEIARLVN